MERRRFLRFAGGSLVVGSGVATVSFAGTDGVSALVAGNFQRVASNLGDATIEAHGSVAVRRLIVSVSERERLRSAGFAVPESYPTQTRIRN